MRISAVKVCALRGQRANRFEDHEQGEHPADLVVRPVIEAADMAGHRAPGIFVGADHRHRQKRRRKDDVAGATEIACLSDSTSAARMAMAFPPLGPFRSGRAYNRACGDAHFQCRRRSAGSLSWRSEQSSPTLECQRLPSVASTVAMSCWHFVAAAWRVVAGGDGLWHPTAPTPETI